MFAEPVVEDFDVLENIRPQTTLVPEYRIANRAAFVSTVKRFHCCVIIAVSFGAHARFEVVLLEQSLVTVACIGTASIRVMNDTSA